MKKDNIFKTYLILFVTFFKIGLFTFGGGYAMIPLIQRETADKRSWVKQSDILDIIAIAESTPGPIAVNAATYIGFYVGKFWGSFFATLGLVTPSFLIILGLSYCYKSLIGLAVIEAIFKGLRVGVIILLFNAFIKLSKSFKLSPLAIIMFVLVLGVNIALAIMQVKFNYTSIICIALGLLTGIIATALSKRRDV